MSRLFRISRWLLAGLLLISLAGYLTLTLLPSFGAGGNPPRSAAVLASAQFDGNRFANSLPGPARPAGYMMDYLERQFGGDEIRTPPGELPVQNINPASLSKTPGLRAYWLGHASVLIELDGQRLLIDPVFSDHASPFNFTGPRRFHPPPIALKDLPAVDAVMISHDHYDHLDMATIQHLANKGTRFLVPLGIDEHLRRWQVPDNQIVALDWGESESVGSLTITCTPAQHYSGRELRDTRKTLWSSWAMAGPEHRVFYSGDTGFSDHFKNIGDRYGPFDLTVIKVGAYGPGKVWTEVHMTAEQSIEAHIAVQGKRMLPVHWGTFNMAFHSWDEPIERAIAASRGRAIDLVTPRIGEKITAGAQFPSSRWWRKVGGN